MIKKYDYFIVSKFDFKNNKALINVIKDINHITFISLEKFCNLELSKRFLTNNKFVEKNIHVAALLGNESLILNKDSVDEIGKCIIRQENNYLAYLINDEFYNSKNKINTLKLIALIAFNLIKGHYLINGNKRIAYVFMTTFLKIFGFNTNYNKNLWNKIYEEWKMIAGISTQEKKKGIDKIYKLMVKTIIIREDENEK